MATMEDDLGPEARRRIDQARAQAEKKLGTLIAARAAAKEALDLAQCVLDREYATRDAEQRKLTPSGKAAKAAKAAATKAVDERLGDAGAPRMVGPGRETIEQSARPVEREPVVFTITVGQSVTGMRIEGPATGLGALAALSIFFEMIKTAHDVSPTMPVAWLPGLAAAREELRSMTSIMRTDLTPFSADGGAR